MSHGKPFRDPRAETRFLWGQAALEEGAHEEAADLFAQAIELAPDWIGAHLRIAEASIACGDDARAEAALRHAASLDASDRHGAGLLLARLLGEAPIGAPPAYVANLFDDYASRFEAHLTYGLDYTGPADLLRALRKAGFARAKRALDLGCGTGLCGAALRPDVAWLAGVDLAPRMIALAAAKTSAGCPLYDRLAIDDLHRALEAEPIGSLDLIVAADVFIYIGDLAPVFAVAGRALSAGGFLAFTAQSHAGNMPFLVGADLRFAHATGAIAKWLDAAGFVSVSMDENSVRRENGRAVPGLVVVARRR